MHLFVFILESGRLALHSLICKKKLFQCKMSKKELIESLRAFVNERLNAAAREICGAVEKTIEEYEEPKEQGQNEMLQLVIKPGFKIGIEDSLLVNEDKDATLLQQQQRPEVPQVKEEEEQIPTSQGLQQLTDDIVIFTVSPSLSVKSEHDLDFASNLNQNVENGGKVSVLQVNPEKSDETIKVELGEEDSEDTQLAADCQPVSCVVSEDESEGSEEPESETESNDKSQSDSEELQKDLDGGKIQKRCRRSMKSYEDNEESESDFETLESKRSKRSVETYAEGEDSESDVDTSELNNAVTADSAKRSMKSHVKSVRQSHSDPCTCKLCGKSFSYKANLIKHASCHAENQEFLCGICGMRLDSTENLKCHLESHIKETKTCPTCGKIFEREALLKVHMRIHSGEKPYSCKDCGRGFYKSSALNSHMRIHTGEKPYKCNMCLEKFTHRTTCIRHIMAVHTDKMYSCRDCGKEFSDQRKLNSHMKAHRGMKPYSCDFCGKEFKYVGNLDIHKKVHTADTSYICDLCGRGFSQSKGLQQHLKAHTGQKPYLCCVCNKGFISSENLDTHMRIHTEEKLYKCNFCPKRFISQTNCNMHMKFHRETS
ncbi:zinc finger protein 235-like [Myripristis murdjan]|uniref:zinc finger protein 235-like n=1 Tax=Myripristis murdjan TaxID=586833 RepID=UPI0011762CB9|nr:zinc finger protein 235-like [Myripristis murdjan]